MNIYGDWELLWNFFGEIGFEFDAVCSNCVFSCMPTEEETRMTGTVHHLRNLLPIILLNTIILLANTDHE